MPHALKQGLGDVPVHKTPGPLVSSLTTNILNGPILNGGPPDLNEAVRQALVSAPDDLRECGIIDGDSFLSFAQGMLEWIPSESVQGRDIYVTLCVFYFVLDQDAVRAQQTAISPDQIILGKPIITKLSQWIIDFANAMGLFMDTPDSLTQQSYESFMRSAPYNLAECQFDQNDPRGGFTTFNDLFSRKVKVGARPIWCRDDDRQIVFPADSTLDDIYTVGPESEVVIKTLQWKISDLLAGDNLPSEVPNFIGGVWMHAFLGPNDYHRQHAPVGGNVIYASVVPGLTYLNVVADQDKSKPNAPPRLRPIRPILGDAEAPDNPGYQFMQARGLIIIHNDLLGYVAVLPIGMAQVSSVVIEDTIKNASPTAPVLVAKGDPISYFQFGGSDIVLVFEQKANVSFKFPADLTQPTPATPGRPRQNVDDYYPGQHGRVGELLAIASP